MDTAKISAGDWVEINNFKWEVVIKVGLNLVHVDPKSFCDKEAVTAHRPKDRGFKVGDLVVDKTGDDGSFTLKESHFRQKNSNGPDYWAELIKPVEAIEAERVAAFETEPVSPRIQAKTDAVLLFGGTISAEVGKPMEFVPDSESVLDSPTFNGMMIEEAKRICDENGFMIATRKAGTVTLTYDEETCKAVLEANGWTVTPPDEAPPTNPTTERRADESD